MKMLLVTSTCMIHDMFERIKEKIIGILKVLQLLSPKISSNLICLFYYYLIKALSFSSHMRQGIFV